RDLAFAFFDLTQLFLLIDALTRLTISSQHRFRSRAASSREFVFKTASFLRRRTCRFFALTEVVSDPEFEFSDFGQLGFRVVKNSSEFLIFGYINEAQQLAQFLTQH